MDAQTRPQLLAKPRGRGFAQAPTAIIFFVIQETGTEEPDEPNPDFYVSTWSATMWERLSTMLGAGGHQYASIAEPLYVNACRQFQSTLARITTRYNRPSPWHTRPRPLE